MALPMAEGAGLGKATWVRMVCPPPASSQDPGTQRRPGWGHSLAKEALGDGAQLSPTVLDQVHLLVHHHVVKLLPLLRDHDVRIPFHAQLQACGGDTVSTSAGEQSRQACGS